MPPEFVAGVLLDPLRPGGRAYLSARDPRTGRRVGRVEAVYDDAGLDVPAGRKVVAWFRAGRYYVCSAEC